MNEASARVDVEVTANSKGDEVVLVSSSATSQPDEGQVVTNVNNNSSSMKSPSRRNGTDASTPKTISSLSAVCGSRDCDLLLGSTYHDEDAVTADDSEQYIVVNRDSVNGDDNDEANAITEESDLRNGSRTIWIVTTAALPWRTGTSVNPLWRAVYLAQDGHKVSLLIPWLADENSRKKLYGAKNYFPHGQSEQIEWIFDNFIGTERSKVLNLQILFWNGIYQESFGSIFPVEDICSLIPYDEADVAILEEPEHLNWFRIIPPQPPKKKSSTHGTIKIDQSDSQKVLLNEENADEDDETEEDGTRFLYGCPNISSVSNPADIELTGASKTNDDEYDIITLGWACKFRYVIGILHTNYGDYVRQYGMMTMFLGASALQALSSMVVRAYCHKVIRLSDTLPSFWAVTHNPHYKYPPGTTEEGLAEVMETTCNVHGVRTDFLDPPVETKRSNNDEVTPAPVYFIGKIIWAKGFEQLLELQELYRSHTSEYFEIDVYGTGNDEKTIQRAFFGRNGMARGSSTLSSSSDSSRPTSPDPYSEASDYVVIGKTHPTSLRSQVDQLVLMAHANPTTTTILPPTCTAQSTSSTANPPADESKEASSSEHDNASAEAPAATAPLTDESTKNTTVDPLNILGEATQKTVGTGVETADAAMKMVESIFQIGLGAFSFGGNEKGKAKLNGQEDGTVKSADGATDAESNQGSLSSKTNKKPVEREQVGSIPFKLAPARARFKWRRNPIPARFPGVHDHIIVRDIPEHKGTHPKDSWGIVLCIWAVTHYFHSFPCVSIAVFLNMSTSEVLCTTSAEALAMGKFVILPKHRKLSVTSVCPPATYV